MYIYLENNVNKNWVDQNRKIFEESPKCNSFKKHIDETIKNDFIFERYTNYAEMERLRDIPMSV
jgi:hypothetical protein